MIRAGDVERRRHRRDGVDVERAVPAAAGALRLPARRRHADRPDGRTTGSRRASTAGHMVEQASFVSRELGISREDQDALGAPLARARRGARRTPAGFDDEIVAVGELDADEGLRRDTTLEKLAALKPVFDPEGTTTAGNAPGVNDGASLRRRLLRGVRAPPRPRAARDDRRARAASPTSSRTSRARRRRPARWRSSRPGKTIGDVERVEINEAFASVASNSTRMLGVDEEIVNVNGGAIALGHPIGASGGRIARDARARAAPHRRRPRPRRDLLRRRPGRRAPDRGLTQRDRYQVRVRECDEPVTTPTTRAPDDRERSVVAPRAGR